jgi:hypothetical protein
LRFRIGTQTERLVQQIPNGADDDCDDQHSERLFHLTDEVVQPGQTLRRNAHFAHQTMTAVTPHRVPEIVATESGKPSHHQHRADEKIAVLGKQVGPDQQGLARRGNAKSFDANCSESQYLRIQPTGTPLAVAHVLLPGERWQWCFSANSHGHAGVDSPDRETPGDDALAARAGDRHRT